MEVEAPTAPRQQHAYPSASSLFLGEAPSHPHLQNWVGRPSCPSASMA